MKSPKPFPKKESYYRMQGKEMHSLNLEITEAVDPPKSRLPLIKNLLKLIFLLTLTYLVYVLFREGEIAIWLSTQPEPEHTLYLLLNSTLLGLYINSLGFDSGKRPWQTKVVTIGLVLTFLVLGYSGVAIGVYVNIPILLLKTYEMNSKQGILFFLGNLPLLITLFGLTFLTEGD